MRSILVAVAFIACTALACSDPESRLPTSPSVPTVSVIEISGPGTIAPGQSVQLSAMVVLTDGTRKLSTPDTPIVWSTSGSLLQVSPTGLLTASQNRGEGRVTARIGTGTGARASIREFVIVPDGTYRLVGRVFDSESPSFPLTGVRVEIPQAGLVTQTDSEGSYRLYGVPPTAAVEVSKTGYATVSQPLQLTTHSVRDFQLALTGSRVVLNGNYTLTVDMPGCEGTGALPADLRRRTYEATVTQTGPLVEVVLTEPRFSLNHGNRGNRFSGYADTVGVTFILDPFVDYYYYGPQVYPSVAERLPNNTILVPSGRSIVVRAGAGLSGGFNASFTQYESRFPAFNTSVLGFCRSAATQLTLTPR